MGTAVSVLSSSPAAANRAQCWVVGREAASLPACNSHAPQAHTSSGVEEATSEEIPESTATQVLNVQVSDSDLAVPQVQFFPQTYALVLCCDKEFVPPHHLRCQRDQHKNEHIAGRAYDSAQQMCGDQASKHHNLLKNPQVTDLG